MQVLRFRLRKMLQLFLFSISHHPHCKLFSNHTIQIKGIPVCLGCLCAYPSAVFSFMFALAIQFYLSFPIQLYILVTVMFASLVIFQIIDFFQSQRLKIASKISLGTASGLWFFIIFSFENINRLLLLTAFLGVLLIFSIIRIKKMLRTCHECYYQATWHVCPGFWGFYALLYELCEKCGQKFKLGSKFCHFCGNTLFSTVFSIQEVNPTLNNPYSKDSNPV
ncbi:MAG: hypothetical protein ACFFC7_21035 [Candidatus Hermodarchaeota archaeon]